MASHSEGEYSLVKAFMVGQEKQVYKTLDQIIFNKGCSCDSPIPKMNVFHMLTAQYKLLDVSEQCSTCKRKDKQSWDLKSPGCEEFKRLASTNGPFQIFTGDPLFLNIWCD